MLLESIKLVNFRQFKDEYIEFAKGQDGKNVTIIIGENGNMELNTGNQKIPMQTIGVWDFSDKDDLFEISDTRFIPKSPDENPELRSEKFVIQQGMLELSNTNVIKEMINTIY